MLSARRAPLALLTAVALLLGVFSTAAVPAHASTTASVSVTLLAPDGSPFTWGAGGERLKVELTPMVSGFPIAVPMNADGTGEVVVPVSTYRVKVEYTGRQNILNGWAGVLTTTAGGTVHTVAAGVANQITEQLHAGGTITGSVTGDNFPLDYAFIDVYPQTAPNKTDDHAAWFDPETQQYTITRLRPSTYQVLINGGATGQPELVAEWIGGEMVIPTISPIIFGSPPRRGQTVVATPGSSFVAPALSLEQMSKLTGVVSWPGTRPSTLDTSVVAYLDGVKVGEVGVSLDGTYRLRDVARLDGDELVVCISSAYSWNRYRWAESCWSPGGTAARNDAGAVPTVPKSIVSGINMVAVEGVVLSYTARYDLDGPGGVAPDFSYSVQGDLYRLSADGERFEFMPVLTAPNGSATLFTPPVMPGTYAVQFVDEERPQLGRTWLTAAGTTSTTFTVDNEIVVPAGPNVSQNVVLRPFTRVFDRIAGSDRFETAVRISEATIDTPDTPASVVYIANGLNYPDALSAGPIAALQGGTMLLVLPTSIPATVRTELERLRPERIVVVGGVGAVSAAVQAQLSQFVDDDANRVSRVSGADRYAVSRALVDRSFPGQTGMPIFIATGSNYPDALAAGPAAAALGGAVLLVNGNASTIDTPTRQLLDRLKPSAIVVVGGPAVVSNGILAALESSYGWESVVIRRAGTDRYSGAAVLNSVVFAESTIAFLATGTSFADALAGGALAGQLGAPLYLTQPQCIPIAAHEGMTQLRSSFAVILGGTGVVSANVERGGICGARSSEARASIPAPSSQAQRQALVDIERFREAVGLP